MAEQDHDAVVIGTGPSACALVAALLERGVRPLVVESSQDQTPSPVGAAAPDNDYVGFKTWNGSDAMYRPHPAAGITYDDRLRIRASNYLGGLSRVWGATYDQYAEYRRWPKDCIPSAADWSLVAGLIPRSVTGQPGTRGPDGLQELAVAPRLRDLIDAFKQREEPASYRVQPSNLALQTRTSAENHCNRTGQCLSGCPRESIWWAGAQFSGWAAAGDIELVRGWYARSFEESDNGVRLRMQDASGVHRDVVTRRLFIGAGPIATAAIMLRSTRLETVTIRDSMTGFTGMLDLGRARNGLNGYHTLSHVWARTRDDTSFAIQLYPQDPSHGERLRKSFPHAPQALLTALNRRFYPAIAYLDSDASGTIEVTQHGDEVRVAPGLNGDRARMVRHVTAFGLRAARLGFALPSLLTQVGAPGGGFHIGSSFAHGDRTDDLGRPRGLERVHIVDSSVLPHLEAGSITPTVMANAGRIGRLMPMEAGECTMR